MNTITGFLATFSSAAIPHDSWIWDAGLSVGIFVVVVLLVVAVFRQPPEMKLSYQRQAALATGHSDRRTVFEVPSLRPILWLLLSASYSMALPRLKQWIKRTLVSSGNENYYTPEEYLALSMFYGMVIGLFLSVFHLVALGDFSFLLLVFGFIGGMGLMLTQLYDKARKRLRLITRRVPYALDLIALAMGAGATFTEAVKAVVREDDEDPFNSELKAVLAEIELGTTRRQALENLADRVPIDMLRSIVASVIQAEELGTPLAEVLHSQATLLRLQRSVRAENLAAVASIRILIPSLLILFSVILAVFGPAIMMFIRQGGIF